MLAHVLVESSSVGIRTDGRIGSLPEFTTGDLALGRISVFLNIVPGRVLPALLLLSLLSGIALPIRAGTLSGNVKVGNGESVIYLAPLHPSKFPHPARTYVIHQKSMRFVPGVLVVPQGATVEFPNEDIAPHNVYWKSIGSNRRLAHDMGIIARGHEASWTFTHAGDVFIQCSFHREMSAHIIVTPSPYFAKSDAILGDYFITGVPDGKYRVSVWHNGSITSKLITVAGDTRANFNLTH